MQVLGRHFGLGHQKLNLSKFVVVVFHDPQMSCDVKEINLIFLLIPTNLLLVVRAKTIHIFKGMCCISDYP